MIHLTTEIINAKDAIKKKDRERMKQEPIKVCAKLTEKLLTTAHKSKVLKFKLDEDPLHYWIYFLTFMESLEMIFHSTRKLVRYFYFIQLYEDRI